MALIYVQDNAINTINPDLNLEDHLYMLSYQPALKPALYKALIRYRHNSTTLL